MIGGTFLWTRDRVTDGELRKLPRLFEADTQVDGNDGGIAKVRRRNSGIF